MIYLYWILLTLLDWVLLLTVPFAAVIIAARTKEQPHNQAPYSWGGIWGTHDNPPQGDEGFVRKRALFPGVTTGFKGYLNRVHWMIRNPLYGFAKKCEIQKTEGMVLSWTGDPSISDKEKRPGRYFAKLLKGGKLVGFEFYLVWPYSETKDVRIRLGWKLMSRRWEEQGYAQLVNSINPLDGYGDK